MAPHHSPVRRLLSAAALVLVALAGLALVPTAAHAAPVEGYATYEPQRKCSPAAKPGMEHLAQWAVRRFGGVYGGISRACGGSASEHKEGRAFDWTMDADDADDQARVQRFLTKIFKTDRRGNEHAMARRMGIMYVIWDDQMYAAYDRFAPKPYLHSGCKKLAKCSKTLRHRDHVHISLSRAGGDGTTSWFVRQLARAQRPTTPQEKVEAVRRTVQRATAQGATTQPTTQPTRSPPRSPPRCRQRPAWRRSGSRRP